jgi:hypothetical protein
LPFRRRRKRDNSTSFVGSIRTHHPHSAHDDPMAQNVP